MQFFATALFISLYLPSLLTAGPWPRGEGNVFLSSSAFLTWPAGRVPEAPDIYGSGFAEYGLTDRLTLGLDIGSPDYMNMDRLKAVGFVKYSLSAPEAIHQVALDLGGGTDQGTGVIRLGASYGRGWSLMDTPGWFTLSGVALYAPERNENTFGLDMTVGVSSGDMKYIAQLSAMRAYDGADYISVTPSAVRKIGKHLHLEIGASFGIRNKPDPALKLGIWQEF